MNKHQDALVWLQQLCFYNFGKQAAFLWNLLKSFSLHPCSLMFFFCSILRICHLVLKVLLLW